MKILELKTKKIIEVNESYGARLIEHGMAILPPNPPRMATEPQKEMPKEPRPRKKGDA